eukprot:995941_1
MIATTFPSSSSEVFPSLVTPSISVSKVESNLSIVPSDVLSWPLTGAIFSIPSKIRIQGAAARTVLNNFLTFLSDPPTSFCTKDVQDTSSNLTLGSRPAATAAQ